MAAGSSYMQTANAAERNQEATVFVGGLDEKVSDEILWELMIQAGPVKHVYIPRDRITRQAQGYGFCEFRTEEDAQYAVRILNMIKLYGKPIKVQPSSEHKRNMEVGANIFIGNLDPDVDEKTLHDTFSAFGLIIETPHIMRDPETGNSRGYGFVKFNSFEASDAAIEAMNGGFIMNRSIVVQYAFKKDGHNKAERLLAAKGQDTITNASNAGNYAPPAAGGSVQNHWQMAPSGPPPPRPGGYGYPGGYGAPEGGEQPPPPPPQGPSGAPPAMGIPAHAPPSGPMGPPPAAPPPLPADPSGQMHPTTGMRAPMPPPAQYSQQYNSSVQPPAAEMPPPPGAPMRPPPPPVPRQPIENMPPPPRT